MMLYALEAAVRGDNLLVVIVVDGFQLLGFIGSVAHKTTISRSSFRHNITLKHISGELTSAMDEDFHAVQTRWALINVQAFDVLLFNVFSQRLHRGKVYR